MEKRNLSPLKSLRFERTERKSRRDIQTKTVRSASRNERYLNEINNYCKESPRLESIIDSLDLYSRSKMTVSKLTQLMNCIKEESSDRSNMMLCLIFMMRTIEQDLEDLKLSLRA